MSLLETALRAARNASDLLRHGRLGPAWRTPFRVHLSDACVSLRHYGPPPAAPAAPTRPLLLVPPLMVTAEVYDIAPDLSAVATLSHRGADVWLADFGAPEATASGLDRTLDDHVLAIGRCIDAIAEATGQEVHLIGYSQGGLFCYQAAAYRKGATIASVTAFGSPVDIRRNLPVRVHDTLTARLIAGLERLLRRPLSSARGIPGTLSSAAFKLLAPRQELKHLIQMIGLLHDRDALVALEPRRRFLGGEGFIAWPGPALRTFIDEFIVHNRLKRGGFVIDGRTVSLADIPCPIFCFIGTRDDLAFPDAVRGIVDAAPDAPIELIEVPAGHFGLIIGTQARERSWPTVLDRLARLDGALPPLPALAADPPPAEAPSEDLPRRTLWDRLGAIGVEVGGAVDTARWNLPRLMQLLRLSPETPISYARTLRQQARKLGEDTFFLWQGRAYTFGEADSRVSALMRALIAAGVRPDDRVGLRIDHPPTLLSLIGALNRLGAIAVLEAHDADGPSPFDGARVAAAIRAAREGGGGLFLEGPGAAETIALEPLLTDATSLETATVETTLPAGWRADGMTGAATALLLCRGDATPRRVSNRRWVATGLDTASRAELSTGDTVWSCLPLSSRDGLLAATGAALTSGARLALSETFQAETFWRQIRHVGATVAFVEASALPALLALPEAPSDDRHPLRLFIGRGLDPALEAPLKARFGQRVELVNLPRRRQRRRARGDER